MQVTSILENTTRMSLPVEHGLSLYIELDGGLRVLFDMGQSALFARNAEALGRSIADVDVAILSHGHYDHGGGLRTFLDANGRARVFVHRDAFLPHYSLRDTGLRYIGLDTALQGNARLVFCSDVTRIAEGLTLIAEVQGDRSYPAGNRLLYGPTPTVHDDFCHEQSLVVEEGDRVVLFAGCAHRGILNILRRVTEVVGRTPTHVFAGIHLVKSRLDAEAEDAFIRTLASGLQQYHDTQFYTMHCTGEAQYERLRTLMGTQIEYLACGDSVNC